MEIVLPLYTVYNCKKIQDIGNSLQRKLSSSRVNKEYNWNFIKDLKTLIAKNSKISMHETAG